MKRRPVRGRASAPALSSRGAGAAGAGGRAQANPIPANPTQLVVDPGYDDDTKHSVTGSGAGTTAVAAGVLTIDSTTDVYRVRPTVTPIEPLLQGTYQTTFTVSSYATGAISVCASANSGLTSSTNGVSRSADGTYTEVIVLHHPTGYIGLSGRGAAVVNSMVIDNFTIIQVA